MCWVQSEHQKNVATNPKKNRNQSTEQNKLDKPNITGSPVTAKGLR
jgi:hypothetical protein